jgi:hypothetical protein
VASGLDEYYTGAGEAPGVWVGSGLESLGLVGGTGIPLPGERLPNPEHELIERIHVSGAKQLVSARDADAARISERRMRPCGAPTAG